METEQPWSQQDYNWNPFRLVATPASEPQPTLSTNGLLPPISAAAAAAAGFTAQVRYGSGLAPLNGLDSGLDPRQRVRSSTICQVDGCNESLKALKEYHQRYKICEYHLKVPSIVREGVRQRFCQQCGRFHDLSEFDGDKRSCRARLQRHNARRRKKPDDPLKVSAPRKSTTLARRTSPSGPQTNGARSSGRQAAKLAAALQKEMENGLSVSAAELSANPHSLPMVGPPLQHGSGQGRQNGAPGGGRPVNLENALSELLHESQARHQGSAVSLEAIQEFLDDGQSQLARSTAALSTAFGAAGLPLLGAPPGGFTNGHPAAKFIAPLPPPCANGHNANVFAHDHNMFAPATRAVGSFNSGNNSGGSNIACGGMNAFGSLADSLSAGASWPGMNGEPIGDIPNGLPPPYSDAMLQMGHRALQSHGSAPVPMRRNSSNDLDGPGSAGAVMQRNSGGYNPLAAGVRSLSDQSNMASMAQDMNLIQEADAPLHQTPSSQYTAASVLTDARALLGSGGYQAPYEPADFQLMRVSAKLFNCAPEHLPADLKGQLVGLLQCGANGLEGYIRPGCTHLTLNAQLEASQAAQLRAAGARAAALSLIGNSPAGFWAERPFMLQMFDEVALVSGGRVLHVLSAHGSCGVFPHVTSVSPRFVASGETPLVAISGRNVAGDSNFVLARSQGRHVPVRVAARTPAEAGGSQTESLVVHLPEGGSGAVFLEVARGGFLSVAAPLLVLHDVAAVEELRQLETDDLSVPELEAIIVEMSQVLEFGAVLDAEIHGRTLDGPARSYSPADVEAISHIARKLLVLACQKGWPAVARLVLPSACADCESVGVVMDALQDLVAQQLTPLHLAVRSQSAELVDLLLGWACAGGYEWSVNVPGPRGITPLHLSALLPDFGTIAVLLAGGAENGSTAWFAAHAEDGSTPADFAKANGNTELNERIRATPARAHNLAGGGSSSKEIEGETAVGAKSKDMEEVVCKPGVECEAAEEGERTKAGGSGRRLSMPQQLYREYYEDCDMFGITFAPTVFDRTSTAITAGIVLAVGGAMLLLRHFVDVMTL